MIAQQITRDIRQTRTFSPTRKDPLLLRAFAVLLVLLALGSTIWLSTSVLAEHTSILHQVARPNMGHADGTIVHVAADRSFTLKTGTGQVLSFVCDQLCHASLPHLQRHRREKAHTDVYYLDATGDHLLHALYVD